MNKEEFVEVIKLVVVNATKKGMKESLTEPPGRQPRTRDVALSQFYNSLDENGKTNIDLIVEQSVDFAVFQFLCVLDGVVAIEDKDKGELKLYYEKGGEEELLNDPNEEFLHDLFSME